jgi:serine-type D-Ala-D-Ala carboxypeptidase/endopeptidase
VVREKKSVAIVAGLLDESGVRVIGFGPPFKGSDLTVAGDSLFEIGSITKTFTTTLLSDMVERCEVRLNDPIAMYLPASVRAPTRNGKEITLLHLATHTSGLPRDPDNLEPFWWKVCVFCADDTRIVASYSMEKMYAFLSGHTLQRDIEAQSSYSSYGMVLLGQMLARRAGMDFGTLVRTRITGPLDMHDTVITVSPEQQARLASGYTASGRRVTNWDRSKAYAPSGGLKSTVNDLFTYIRANLGATRSPLLPAMRRAQRPQYSTGNAAWGVGLGWQILRGLDGNILLHDGATSGYVSFIAFDPKRRAGVVVLSNSYNDITDIGMHLLDPVQYPLGRDAKARKAIRVDAVTLLELQKSYYFKVTRDGTRLFVETGGQGRVEVFAESDRDFFWLPQDAKGTLFLSDAQATFVRDGSGVVSQLVLHSNGNHWPATKLR